MKAINTSTLTFSDPVTAPVLIPVEHKSTPSCINEPFMVDGKVYGVTALSFGSPHGAVFVENADAVDVAALGLKLGSHVLFPEGASIVFIEVTGRESVKARLWQRGEGEIMYTNEAAAVAGTAAMMLQKVLSSKVSVHMGYYVTRAEWERSGRGVSLTGLEELLSEESEESCKLPA